MKVEIAHVKQFKPFRVPIDYNCLQLDAYWNLFLIFGFRVILEIVILRLD